MTVSCLQVRMSSVDVMSLGCEMENGDIGGTYMNRTPPVHVSDARASVDGLALYCSSPISSMISMAMRTLITRTQDSCSAYTHVSLIFLDHRGSGTHQLATCQHRTSQRAHQPSSPWLRSGHEVNPSLPQVSQFHFVLAGISSV